jgi:hypothetical protein
MTNSIKTGKNSTGNVQNDPENKSGAHTQAGQQSQTGGGSRQHGQDRAAVAGAGSKGGRDEK